METLCPMETYEKNAVFASAIKELEAEREKTIRNMSVDICKMSKALCDIDDLSEEGKIIREDLLGLLEFESDKMHQIDSLMIERRKKESSGRRFYKVFDKSDMIQ